MYIHCTYTCKHAADYRKEVQVGVMHDVIRFVICLHCS